MGRIFLRKILDVSVITRRTGTFGIFHGKPTIENDKKKSETL